MNWHYRELHRVCMNCLQSKHCGACGALDKREGTENLPDEVFFSWTICRGEHRSSENRRAGACSRRILRCDKSHFIGGNPSVIANDDTSPCTGEARNDVSPTDWIGRCVEGAAPYIRLCVGAFMIYQHFYYPSVTHSRDTSPDKGRQGGEERKTNL